MVAMGGSGHAQTVETKGGLKVTSADGQYSGQLGGRIHFDTNFFTDDDDVVGGLKNDVFMRRARLTMQGHAGRWTYKFENDFVASDRAGFREMWIGTEVAGANLRLGQAKPYRGMEDLTSSNEVLFMERPYATSSGIFDGRQYQTGAFADGTAGKVGWGSALYSLKSADQPANDGFGVNARGYYAPIVSDTTAVHLGLSYSLDNPDFDNAANNVRARARAIGRADGVTRPTLATVGQGVSGSRNGTLGFEAALQRGRFSAQTEYARSTFEQDTAPDVDVDAFYLQASMFMGTGQKRYDFGKGVFKAPGSGGGETELKVRYDRIDNDGPAPDGSERQWAVGFNHYFNRNVRAMVEYVMAEIEPSGMDVAAVTTRLQFAF